MKKIIALSCLTAMLLAGCGPKTGDSSPKTSQEETTAAAQNTEAETTTAEATTEASATEATTVETTEPPVTTHDGNVSAGGIMDMYPAIYQGFIKAEFEKVAAENDGTVSIEYTFRDLDADGIPELIFKRGTCEADFAVNVFTIDSEGEIKDLGLIGGGHTTFCYDENTGDFVMQWAHMGAGCFEYFKMVNGAVTKAQDAYEYNIGQDESYDDICKAKGIRTIYPYVTSYRSSLNGGIVSYFVTGPDEMEEKDGLYLDYMG